MCRASSTSPWRDVEIGHGDRVRRVIASAPPRPLSVSKTGPADGLGSLPRIVSLGSLCIDSMCIPPGVSTSNASAVNVLTGSSNGLSSCATRHRLGVSRLVSRRRCSSNERVRIGERRHACDRTASPPRTGRGSGSGAGRRPVPSPAEVSAVSRGFGRRESLRLSGLTEAPAREDLSSSRSIVTVAALRPTAAAHARACTS